MVKTVTVPAGTTAAQAALATKASEAIKSTLSAADEARDGLIVQRFGADITPAALRLAKRAADEQSGASKSKGGARADVLAVLSTVATAPAFKADSAARVYVAAAVARMAANAAAVKTRRERKQSLSDTLKDSKSTLQQRTAALTVLSGMETEDSNAKRAAAHKGFLSAVNRAVEAGVPVAELIGGTVLAIGNGVAYSLLLEALDAAYEALPVPAPVVETVA